MGAALGSMSVVLLFSSMPSQAYAQTYPAVQDEVEMDASSQAGQVCGVRVCVTSGCDSCDEAMEAYISSLRYSTVWPMVPIES